MSTNQSNDEMRDMVLDTAGRLFADHVDHDLWQTVEAGTFADDVWQAVVEMGLPRALLDEDHGGPALDLADGLALAELAGYYGLPLPLAETLVGNHLRVQAGQPVDDTVLTLAAAGAEPVRLAGDRATGHVERVAWGRHAQHLWLDADDDDGHTHRVLVDATNLAWTHDTNLAGEPRDSAPLDSVRTIASVACEAESDRVLAWGALVRALQCAGAERRALELATVYATERKQFGRPISRFQAVQQQLASMAGEVAVAGAAAQAAARAVAAGQNANLMIAIGKARVGESAGRAAAVAHQVLAAMGFTQEHVLQYFTRRLWSWRDEFGAEPYWQAIVGDRALAAGGDGLWPFISEL